MSRLMVIEDSEAVRALLVSVCADANGTTVDEAGSIAEALVKMRLNPPDVVFLDLFLPDNEDLHDLLAGYRAIAAEFPQASIVIVSAYSPNVATPEGARMISKPPVIGDIKLAVQQAAAEAMLKREGQRLRDKIEELPDQPGK